MKTYLFNYTTLLPYKVNTLINFNSGGKAPSTDISLYTCTRYSTFLHYYFFNRYQKIINIENLT